MRFFATVCAIIGALLMAPYQYATSVVFVHLQKAHTNGSSKHLFLIGDHHDVLPQSAQLRHALLTTLHACDQLASNKNISLLWECPCGYDHAAHALSSKNVSFFIEHPVQYADSLLMLGTALCRSAHQRIVAKNINMRDERFLRLVHWLRSDAGSVADITFADLAHEVQRQMTRFDAMAVDSFLQPTRELLSVFKCELDAVMARAQSTNLEICVRTWFDMYIDRYPGEKKWYAQNHELSSLQKAQKFFYHDVFDKYLLPVLDLDTCHAIERDTNLLIIANIGVHHVYNVMNMLAQVGYREVDGRVLDRQILQATYGKYGLHRYPDAHGFELLLQCAQQHDALQI